MGNLAYHRSLVKKHPNLVAQFVALAELADQNPFIIGGVNIRGEDQEQHSTSITTISYKIPFCVNGRQLLVSIGLGDVAINTIFSYQLLCSLKAMIMFESNTLIS
eukprot:14419942-Ditylum_brightwellii.AAC.1